ATVLQSTPSGWRLLLAGGWTGPKGNPFKGLCGGEALPPDLATSLTDLGVDLWNLYGPTETTVWSAAGRVGEDAGLGGPIAGTRLHVLDAGLEPAPVGVSGELFIGGVGLARGYLGRAGLTSERFIADPFGGGGRLYRTGDLVRWNAAGRLEYLGRIDHQVKVRGFRIELGEIEAQLLAQPAVREAVVVARDGTTLVAYVVGDGVDVAAVREGLGRTLPEHMVPGRVVVLERLPLTPNGKIDRKALPDTGAVLRLGEPPEGEAEEALAAIWAELLHVDEVARDDNFFELGGHSLLAVQVSARVQASLRWDLSVTDVFRYPTLRAMAARRPATGDESALLDIDAFIDSLESA
ncbi:non-ribosomal peptide synthetase, partial [Piscinibacter gummiphilus]